MKKIVALGLALILSLTSLAGCSQKTPENVTETINVAALNGPTGMAMANLMDMEDKYDITTYQAPADVTAKVISGEVDVAAVPSNLAAVLYNKTEGDIVAISPIALGYASAFRKQRGYNRCERACRKDYSCQRTGRNT